MQVFGGFFCPSLFTIWMFISFDMPNESRCFYTNLYRIGDLQASTSTIVIIDKDFIVTHDYIFDAIY